MANYLEYSENDSRDGSLRSTSSIGKNPGLTEKEVFTIVQNDTQRMVKLCLKKVNSASNIVLLLVIYL